MNFFHQLDVVVNLVFGLDAVNVGHFEIRHVDAVGDVGDDVVERPGVER